MIDSHCHLDDPAFDNDRDAVIARATQAGIKHFIVPGTTAPRWKRLIKLNKSTHQISIALGLHPYFIAQHQEQDTKALTEALEEHRPVAVGEIGLDFARSNADKDQQIALFKSQLAIAVDFQLPVILHVRKAHNNCLKLLKQYRPVGGVVHAFGGSYELAQEYSKLGYQFGFGGMLTYQHSTKLRALIKRLPLEAILLETDAPDMTGANHHGERNSPEYLPEVVEQIAQLRNQTEKEIIEVTTQNCSKLFSIQVPLL